MVAQRAVRGTIAILASSYANMALGVGYSIVLARLLTPAHFGIFALAMFFFGLFDLRSKVGLDSAFIHHQSTTSHLLATHLVLQIVGALATLGIVAFLMPLSRYLAEATWIGSSLFSALSNSPDPIAIANLPASITPIVLAIAGSMTIEAIGSTARVALEKELLFANSTIVVTGALFISYVAAIGFALIGFTHWALVLQLVVNTLCGTVGFWWMYHRLGYSFPVRPAWSSPLARWMLRFGLAFTFGSIATLVLLQFDNFLVGMISGTAALGYYTQAYKVAQWPTGLVTHVITRASLPTYAKLQSDMPRLTRAFEMSLWLILTLAIPLALAIFVSAPDLMRLLYGDTWLPAAPLLRFLVGYSLLRPLLDDTGALFTALGKPRRVTTILATQAAVLILVATPLTLYWGANGAAIAVGLTFVVGITLAYYLTNRVLVLDLKWTFGPPVLAALGSLTLYFAMTRLVDLNTAPLWFRVLFKSGFVTALFLAILLVLQHRTIVERLLYIRRLLLGQ